MIQVTFSFSSREEAAAFLADKPNAPVVASVPPAEPKKKAGRPKKEDAPAADTKPEVSPDAKTYSEEDVREALQKVVAKFNIETGAALLREHGAVDADGRARRTALPLEKRAAFVAACEAKVA